MTVAEAVRALREHEGLSQQNFGSIHKLSIASIQNWEAGKPPSINALVKLIEAAEQVQRFDLANVFRAQIFLSIGGPYVNSMPKDYFEAKAIEYMLECIRDPEMAAYAGAGLGAFDAAHYYGRRREAIGIELGWLENAHQRFLQEAVRRGYANATEDGSVVWRSIASQNKTEPAAPQRRKRRTSSK
jgi:transcriptional regulator with XRE-family HTH domain